MYSVKINTSNTEALERVVQTLSDGLDYSDRNWNSQERNPAMIVGYLERTIDHALYLLHKEIENQKDLQDEK